MINKRLLIITILVMMCAALVSQCIYWYLLVPRLPQYFRAPFLWWIAVFLPFGIASVIIGSLIKAGRFIPLYAILASVVAIIGRMSFLLATGRPPAHDASWQDMMESADLILSIPWLLIVSLIFFFAMYAGHIVAILVRKINMHAAA